MDIFFIVVANVIKHPHELKTKSFLHFTYLGDTSGVQICLMKFAWLYTFGYLELLFEIC